MILQYDPATMALLAGVGIIIFIIVFFVGVLITKWRAKKKGWDATLKPAIILNLFWLIINIIFSFIPYGFLIALIINIIIGGVVASKLYKQEVGKSIVFCLIVLIIIFIFWIVLFLIIAVIVVGAILLTG